MTRASRPPRRSRLVVPTLVAAACAGALLAFVLHSGPATEAPAAQALATDGRAATGAVPTPVAPAFVPPKPRLLREPQTAARWAPVSAATPARAEPRSTARVVARLATTTPEGTANIVLALETAEDASGRLWVRVRLPVLPSNTTGWVRRSALGGYTVVRTHLVVDVEALTATLYRDDKPIFRAPVGVGAPAWPTPKGRFYVRNRLESFDSPFYGPLAFGTSARSPILTDWPAGGFVGIHGTNRPELLPGRVSHGCIRLENSDILRLGKLMPVGTELTIR
jgi:hypothetical protein